MAFQSPLNPLAFLAQYDEGRAVGRQNKLARLADDTRDAQGRALTGDEGAMNALAGLDSGAYMQTKGFVDARKKAETAEFLGSIYNANTPEAFDAVVKRFKAKGHVFDQGEDQFANRESLLRSGMSVAEQMGIDMQKAASDAAIAQRAIDNQYRRDTFAEVKRHNQAVEGTAAARVSAAAVAKNTPKPLTAPMLRLKRETQDKLLDIDNTIAVLKEAKGYVADVHTGLAPETRARIATMMPDNWVPDEVASLKSSRATLNFNKIMSSEAVKNMSMTLKGATTDREMQRFIDIIADPNAPNDVKAQALDRLLTFAEKAKALANEQLDEFTSPPAGEGAGEGADASTMPEDDVLGAAQKAIDDGADPVTVLERLRQQPGYEDIELEGPQGVPGDGSANETIMQQQGGIDPALLNSAKQAIAQGADPNRVIDQLLSQLA